MADNGGKEGVKPRLIEFSRQAVSRAVLREGLTHPLTLYPPALGILCGLAGTLFASPILIAAGVGGVLVGLAGAVINLFLRGDALAARYLRALNDRQARHEQRVVESLKENLEKLVQNRVVAEPAKRGIEQFERAQKKFGNVEAVLQRKFQVTEITYGRFQSAARQVYLSILDNLEMIGSILTSGGSIDVPYLQSRLKTITARKNADEASAREAEALTDQLDLLRSQLDRVNHLLAANEEAMAQLEQTSAQLALVDTDGKFAATDVETAMGYLSELAEGAAAYDTKPTVQTKG